MFTKGDKITIKEHHIAIFKGLPGVIVGPVNDSYYSWRVLVVSQIPVRCGPIQLINKNILKCSACGWMTHLDPDKIPRIEHHWFDPKLIKDFVIEINESNLARRE